MERLQYGTYWRVTRHNNNERYKVKHLDTDGKWKLQITHDDLEFIKQWLCYNYHVLRKEELNPSYRIPHLDPYH